MSDVIQWRPIKAMCADGKIRTARVRSYWDGLRWCMHADTYFSVPAYTYAKGKRVTGYITGRDNIEPGETVTHEFRAVTYRKNHGAIAAA